MAWYTPLYQAAPTVVPPLSAIVLATGITRFLRSEVYNNALWQTTLRASEDGFVNYVKSQNMPLYQRLYNYMIYERDGGYIISDGQGGFINLKHIAAAAEGYFSYSVLADSWYGWAGDLASVVANVDRYVNEHESTYQEATDIVVGDDSYDYSYIDMCADADAIKIAELIAESSSTTHSFSEALYDYYCNYAENRFLYLLDDIGCKANLTDINTKLTSQLGIVVAEVAFYLGTQMQNPPTDIADLINRLSNLPSSAAHTACCAAFANYLYCEIE